MSNFTFDHEWVETRPSVIIVDDNLSHIDEYMEELSLAGVSPQMIDNVQEAISELKRPPIPYGVLITDMTMPARPTRKEVFSKSVHSLIAAQKTGRYSGKELCEFVISKYPETSIIILTNLSKEEVHAAIPDLPEGIPVLDKGEFPSSVDAILAKIQARYPHWRPSNGPMGLMME